MKEYPPLQFSVFRIIFGSYLTLHFIGLLPYGTELFSGAGQFSAPRILPAYGFFPNLLYRFDSPLEVRIFLSALIGLSLLYAGGIYRKPVSLLLWYGWACLLGRNPFISNPGIPFVGWLLLASSLIPSGEPYSPLPRKKSGAQWEMPPLIFWGAWLLMGLGYSISGLHKLGSPSWLDGSALGHVLQNPLARDNWIRALLLNLPPIAVQIMTWGSLALEIIFGPLSLFRRTRPIAWVAMVGMQLGILSVVHFADLTFGVLMIHLFTVEPRWLKKIATKTAG